MKETTILIVLLLTGLFVVSFADESKAGIGASPGSFDDCVIDGLYECSNFLNQACAFICNDTYGPGRDRGTCKAECKISEECCFDTWLYYECGLGSGQTPFYCR